MKMKKKTVYITGATGRLGQAVLKRTNAVPLVRKPSGLKGEVSTDFSREQLKKILNDATAIFHLAGSVDTLDEKKMQEANVELTKKIVESTPKECKIIFAGSISVYGKKLAQIPANENTETNPDSPYANSKHAAEDIVSGHPNHIILRIGPLYGPQFEDYQRVLSLIEKGKMRLIGRGNNRIPFVHVDDVAEVIANCINKGTGTFVVAGEPLTQEDIFKIACKELGVQNVSKHVSVRTAVAIATLGEWKYKLVGKKPTLTKEHIGILAYDRVFDCTKAKKELGFSSRSLEQGIIEMMQSYRQKKK